MKIFLLYCVVKQQMRDFNVLSTILGNGVCLLGYCFNYLFETGNKTRFPYQPTRNDA